MKCSDLMLFPVSIPGWYRRGSPPHPLLEMGVRETEGSLAELLLMGRAAWHMRCYCK